MPAIFISHSSRDRKAADDVKAALARLRFENVFLDFDKDSGIGAGESWEKRLYEELARCHAVVLVLTPGWLASKWCFAELTQARAQGKVILPIICEPLGEPFVLPDIQAVDLMDWNAEGLARLEQRLNAITDELARGFRLDPSRPPYPGIHAFEAEDAAIYFGRDDETRAVLERLEARRTQGGARLLVTIGASGSGKSSLLKAGVLPQLARRRGQWLPLPTIRPERAPLEAVAKAIAYALGAPDAWEDWHRQLGGAGGVDAFEQLLKKLRVGDARAATVLLPIDQFEEVFTVATADERGAFLGLLAGVLDPARGLPLMVLATGRSDVLDGLIDAGDLAHLYETIPLAPMPLERVPRLVEGPALVAGLNVEQGLAEQVARDVESSEALPLLAQALALLYRGGSRDKRLTIADYVALGDRGRGLNPIQNSVRLAADQAIAGLRPAPTDVEHAALRDAFVPHLVRVRLDDGKRLRQPARLSELPSGARRLIDALIEARLLSTRDGLVEVAHEALFAAWPTLDQWLTDEQAFLTDLERIRAAQEIWAQAPSSDKAGALLHGLLLSRARDWLIKYPQRFAGGAIVPLRDFIAASAAAEDARSARARKVRRRLFQATAAAAIVFAAIAAVAGWQYVAAEHARRAAERNFGIAKQSADHVVFRIAQDLRYVQGMRVESVRRILDAAQALMDELVQAAPDDLPLRRSRAAMFAAFADTYLNAGDVARAQTAADESLAIMRALAAAEPGNAAWQREVSASLNRVGDVRLAAGDRRGALAVYEEGHAIRRQLAASDAGNASWQRDLSVSLEKIGDVRLAAGERTAALAGYQQSLAIMRQLVATDPSNVPLERDLSVILEKVGDAQLSAGDRVAALTAFEEVLAIRRKLAGADPGHTVWPRDVSVSLDKIGDQRLASGDRDGALAAYRESLAIRRRLVAGDASNAPWQRDVAASLDKIGDTLRVGGDRAGALAAYDETLAILRKLVTGDPHNAYWQRDLGISLNKVGDARLAMGDRAGALTAHEESLAIRRTLVASDAGNTTWQRDVSVGLDKVADVRRATGDRTAALAGYEESLAIRRRLAVADPDNVSWRRDVNVSLNKIGDERLAAGDKVAALSAFEESLDIVRALATGDPGHTGLQRGMSVAVNKVGDAKLAVGDRAGALAAYHDGLAVMRKLTAVDPGNAEWQRDLGISLYKVSTVSEPPLARGALREAIEVAERLAHDGKLTPPQQGWSQWLRNILAKLPPEDEAAR
jgi:tetratricopeptide (TPR) repeat protein